MTDEKQAIDAAVEQFRSLMESQLARAKRIREDKDFTDFDALDTIVIGICGGDGIGPVITKESERVLSFLLKDEVASGKIQFKEIDGLTIENRAACNKAIPDDVLAQLKACNVILKGPTTTPRAGDPWPNVESANVAMRKELDLFANMRPVKVPEQGIDWTFFRENTEGGYAIGSYGVNITDDLAVDFTVATREGCERIARLAYDYAQKNHKGKVSIITKANIIKATDGKFLKLCQEVGKNYPEITTDDWYIDIMTAKLLDDKRRRDFKVVVLPNLYGDILSDLTSGLIGGLGLMPSANLGSEYAMFEAVHGSAPDIAGRHIANPTALLWSACMMLDHLDEQACAQKIKDAVNQVLMDHEHLTPDLGGSATTEEYTQAIIDALAE